MSNLDHWRNDGYIICPHCEHKITDVYDYGFNIADEYETEIDCPKCEKVMCITINVEVKFSSSKKE